MHGLIELITRWSDDIQKLRPIPWSSFWRVGSKVQKVFEMKDRLKVVTRRLTPAGEAAGEMTCSTMSVRSPSPARSSLSRSRSTSSSRPSRSDWPATWRCWRGRWLRTGREVYLNLFKYWLKIFALAFAMGVVSGITMSSPVRDQLVGVLRRRPGRSSGR